MRIGASLFRGGFFIRAGRASCAAFLLFAGVVSVPFGLRGQAAQRDAGSERCSSGRGGALCGRDLRFSLSEGLPATVSQNLGSVPNFVDAQKVDAPARGGLDFAGAAKLLIRQSEWRMTFAARTTFARRGPDPSYKLLAKAGGQNASQVSNGASGRASDRAPADFAGVWYPSTGSTLGAATPDNPGQQFVWLGPDGKPWKGPLPLTAWGQEKMKSNRPTGPETTAIDSNDPDFQCFPSGVPRIYLFLYPMEIIHTPGRVLQLFEYGHTIRQILTDGRGHPQDAEPTWMGDSIGHWEADTLVVDTTGFNDKTWLGYGGQPHSEALHVIERIRRTDHDSLTIDITLDDPKAYTMPLHTQKKYILKPDWNLMEFVCEDNSLNFLDYEKKTRIQK